MSLFETERLVGRRITLDDVPAMLAVYGNAESMRYVGDSRPLPEEACRYWVEVTDKSFERRGYGMIALEEKGTGDVIGFAGVVHPGQQEQAEVKYAIRKDRWGEGFATEAVRGLVAHARSAWGVGSMIATVFPENDASQNVLAKAGFTRAEDRSNDDGTTTRVWCLS